MARPACGTSFHVRSQVWKAGPHPAYETRLKNRSSKSVCQTSCKLHSWRLVDTQLSRGVGPVIAAPVRAESELPNAAAAPNTTGAPKGKKSVCRHDRTEQEQPARQDDNRHRHGPPAPDRLLHLDAGQERPEFDRAVPQPVHDAGRGPWSSVRDWGAAVPSRHRRDSFPSDEVVGGFFFDFEVIRTASRDAALDASTRRSSRRCRSRLMWIRP